MKRAKSCLDQGDWEHVKNYFIVNSFPAHPETVLFCAFVSSNSSDEEKYMALQKILEARRRHVNPDSVRKFIYPKEHEINWEAQSIMDILHWHKLKSDYITPPPLLQDFTDDELTEAYLSKQKLDLPKLLCHSQHNEAAVKNTTKEVATNVGHEAQKANIIITGESRKTLPINATKKHFSRKLDFE